MVSVVSGYSRVGSSAQYVLCREKVSKFLLVVSVFSILVLIAALALIVAQFLFFSHNKCRNVAPSPERLPKDAFSYGRKAIAAACNCTTYPQLCVSSLSSFPSALTAKPPQLVAISLKMALTETNATYDVAVNLSKEQGSGIEIAAVRDCIELMDDARDQLDLSISRLSNLDMQAPGSQIKDVQTWISAALTFDTTCSDGFEDPTGPIADQMLKKADGLSKRLSIGLALIAHLGDHLYSWHNSTLYIPPSGVFSLPCP